MVILVHTTFLLSSMLEWIGHIIESNIKITRALELLIQKGKYKTL